MLSQPVPYRPFALGQGLALADFTAALEAALASPTTAVSHEFPPEVDRCNGVFIDVTRIAFGDSWRSDDLSGMGFGLQLVVDDSGEHRVLLDVPPGITAPGNYVRGSVVHPLVDLGLDSLCEASYQQGREGVRLTLRPSATRVVDEGQGQWSATHLPERLDLAARCVVLEIDTLSVRGKVQWTRVLRFLPIPTWPESDASGAAAASSLPLPSLQSWFCDLLRSPRPLEDESRRLCELVRRDRHQAALLLGLLRGTMAPVCTAAATISPATSGQKCMRVRDTIEERTRECCKSISSGIPVGSIPEAVGIRALLFRHSVQRSPPLPKDAVLLVRGFLALLPPPRWVGGDIAVSEGRVGEIEYASVAAQLFPSVGTGVVLELGAEYQRMLSEVTADVQLLPANAAQPGRPKVVFSLVDPNNEPPRRPLGSACWPAPARSTIMMGAFRHALFGQWDVAPDDVLGLLLTASGVRHGLDSRCTELCDAIAPV